MGLTICAKLVECCEGHIDFYSEGEDKGSTFNFSMKMSLPDPETVLHNKKLVEDYTKKDSETSVKH